MAGATWLKVAVERIDAASRTKKKPVRIVAIKEKYSTLRYVTRPLAVI
jgi:hypothetical protein